MSDRRPRPNAGSSAEPSGSRIRDYLADSADPRLPAHLATQSSLPNAVNYASSSYVGANWTPGTSMMQSGADSLAALTASSGRTTTSTSVASSMGIRALGLPRILVPDVDNVLQVAPPQGPTSFECPFSFLHCLLTFSSFNDWFAHSMAHFAKSGPPDRSECCFCDQKFSGDTPAKGWYKRMGHVATHHQLGHRLAHARPMFDLFRYLWGKRLIDNAMYKELMGHGSGQTGYPTPPASPMDRRTSNPSSAYTVTNTRRRRNA